MTCNEIHELYPEYLSDHLAPDERKLVGEHLATCEKCSLELNQMSTIWQNLETMETEQPGPNMRPRFYAMLHDFQKREAKTSRIERLKEWMVSFFHQKYAFAPVYQFAIIIICLVIGFSLGRNIEHNGHASSELSSLRSEVSDMRQLVTLSMLKQPSSSARIQALGYCQNIGQPDSELISALLNTFRSDPNVNVRLAALDALYLFADAPHVRKELIGLLPVQTSPLVQIALIDFLVDRKEKAALDALKTLIENNHLNPAVKQRAEWGVKQLI